jgi:two-component system chemotaxis response regulator CheB
MAKPGGLACGALRPWAAELAARIRTAAHEAQPLPVTCPTARLRPPTFRATGLNPARFLVAIGASTGGPEAVQKLLTSTAADFPPVVIVQHMPAGFTRSFAERLNDSCPLRVTEAHDSDVLTPGRVVVARGDTHLIVRRAAKGWRAYYTRQQLVNGHCPSVNVLFESVAVAAGRQAVGILLTGMGADGAQGLLQLRQQGALTIAQDRDSSVVYGMPKVGVELGAALYSARPERIPALVQRALLARDGKVADAGVRVRS